MSDDVNVIQLNHVSDDVIESIRRQLRRYATTDKLVELPGEGVSIDPFGVQVLYSKANPHLVRFRGVTHDNIEWVSDIDFRAFNRDYLEKFFYGIAEGIQNKRRERRGLGPIIVQVAEEQTIDDNLPDKHPAELPADAADGSIIH